MADQESSVTPGPGLAVQQPDYFATPDNWEMRADMQTPANLRGGQQGNAFSEADGLSYSFNVFGGYDMYETPPGALLYRNHFDDSCGDGSFNLSTCKDEMEIDSGEKYKAEQEALTDECDVLTGIKGSDKDASENPEDLCERLPENTSELVCSYDEEVQKDPKFEDSLNKSDMVDYSKKENFCLNSVTSFSEDIPKMVSEGIESDRSTKQEVLSQKGYNDQVIMKTEESEITECIFEQMDRQEMEQREQTLPSFEGYQPIPHDMAAPCPASFTQKVKSDVEENSGSSGQVLSAASDLFLRVSHISTTETHSSEPFDIEIGYEVKESENKMSTNAENEIQNNDINASLMNMDIPQNAAELDQLADFLNMEDPFQNRDERHAPVDEAPSKACVEEITDVDNGINLKTDHNTIKTEDEECRISPKRTRRKKKPAAGSERRRSVRIARRESLQLASVDTFRDVEPVKPELPNKPTDSINMDINLNEQCSHSVAMSGIAPSSGEPVSGEIHRFEHENIDLPMTKKGASKRNSRRRSVRLHKKNVKTDVLDNVDACNEAQVNTEPKVAGDVTCDRVLLADFADFGLGDDWMPGNMFGESQYAKTPKKTPGTAGRRKSARLSGVPIPMLELHSKSTITISGKDGVNEDDVYQNIPDEGFIQENDSRKAADIPIISSLPPSSVFPLEHLSEMPFEQLDAPVVKPKVRKKRTVNGRRRSVRLAKKPQIMMENEGDGREDSQAEGNNFGNEQVNIETVHGDVSQEVPTQINNCNEIKNQKTVAMPPPISPVELPTDQTESEMEWQQQELNGEAVKVEDMVLPETAKLSGRRTKQVAKDTPFMGKKRVSRIGDTENDDVKTTAMSQDKENEGARVSQTLEAESVERKVLSPNNSIKITKKIKQLYLNKGQDMKKHKAINLETIFESPIVKGKGRQAMAIGAKKMKRMVAFTETPWLGRPGRTKGSKKTKKGKEVKRVLSSQKERCWKLDTMLSTLDYLSP